MSKNGCRRILVQIEALNVEMQGFPFDLTHSVVINIPCNNLWSSKLDWLIVIYLKMLPEGNVPFASELRSSKMLTLWIRCSRQAFIECLYIGFSSKGQKITWFTISQSKHSQVFSGKKRPDSISTLAHKHKFPKDKQIYDTLVCGFSLHGSGRSCNKVIR